MSATSLIPATLGGWLGWVVALLSLGSTAWLGFRKSRIDESALILGKWKEMTERHEEDLKTLRDELRTERADNQSLRDRLRAAEDTIANLSRQNIEQGELIAGLRKQIGQLQATMQSRGVMQAPHASPKNPPEKANRTTSEIVAEINDEGKRK